MTKYKFLCTDIGTTSLKAALVSEMGQVLSFSRINFEHAEKFKISNEWSKALKKAVAEIKNSLNEDSLDCDAICVSGNGPTIVSEDGTTLLWNEKLDFEIKIPEEFLCISGCAFDGFDQTLQSRSWFCAPPQIFDLRNMYFHASVCFCAYSYNAN